GGGDRAADGGTGRLAGHGRRQVWRIKGGGSRRKSKGAGGELRPKRPEQSASADVGGLYATPCWRQPRPPTPLSWLVIPHRGLRMSWAVALVRVRGAFRPIAEVREADYVPLGDLASVRAAIRAAFPTAEWSGAGRALHYGKDFEIEFVL